MKSKVAQLLDRYGYIQDEQATEFNVRRSASVDLPWSICAIIAKLRMKAASIEGVVILDFNRGRAVPSCCVILGNRRVETTRERTFSGRILLC
jgi:hypothetical protein